MKHLIAGLVLLGALVARAPLATADQAVETATAAPTAYEKLEDLGTPTVRGVAPHVTDFGHCCAPQYRRDRVRWFAAAYLWATDVSGTAFSDGERTDFSADFGDILDKVNFGFMGYVQARRDKWFASLDFFYADLESGGTLLDSRLLTLDASVGIKALHFDLRVGYRVWQNQTCISEPCARAKRCQELFLLAGAIYDNMKLDITARSQGFLGPPMVRKSSVESEAIDPIIGARFIQPISRRWTLDASAAIGGLFDQDIWWRVEAYLGWRFSKKWSTFVGYRVRHADDTDGSGAARNGTQVDVQGPVLGLGIHW